jgi:hypothetical protein
MCVCFGVFICVVLCTAGKKVIITKKHNMLRNSKFFKEIPKNSEKFQKVPEVSEKFQKIKKIQKRHSKKRETKLDIIIIFK